MLQHRIGGLEKECRNISNDEILQHRLGGLETNYIDNWIDICGYSQLVIEEIKSYEEPN